MTTTTDSKSSSLELYVRTMAGMGVLFPRLVLAAGQETRGTALPARYERGRQRMCYANAAQLALGEPGLLYCEGYAVSSEMPLALHHAWCLTPNGEVVDPTWERSDRCVYLGIAYARAFCLEHWQEEGVFDVWAEMPRVSTVRRPFEAILDPGRVRDLAAVRAIDAEPMVMQARRDALLVVDDDAPEPS